MEYTAFVEVNVETGKRFHNARKREIKKYIPLTVDEAMDALRKRKNEFSFYRMKDIDTYDVYFVLSNAKVPEIFVMKKYQRKNTSYRLELNAFKKIKEMDDFCKSTLISGKAISKKDVYWILMEYFDGSLINYVSDNNKLTDTEKRSILRKVASAVKCLRDKGLYYTDMKLDQVLYRINDDNILEIKLADLEVSSKGGFAIVTYKPPKNSPYVDKYGHFKDGSTDEAVNWGLVVLILHLWTINNRHLRHAFQKYHRHPKKMLSVLKGEIPDDIYFLLADLYEKWDDITTENLFKALKI